MHLHVLDNDSLMNRSVTTLYPTILDYSGVCVDNTLAHLAIQTLHWYCLWFKHLHHKVLGEQCTMNGLDQSSLGELVCASFYKCISEDVPAQAYTCCISKDY